MIYDQPIFWQYSGWFLAIALLAWLYRWREGLASTTLNRFSGKAEIYAAVLLLGAGLLLRFGFLGEFFGGRLTSDENLVSVIIVSTAVNDELTWHGATHLAYALALDLWYRVFGFTPYTARAYVATLGAIGLLGLYLGLWSLLGKRHALWGTAFLSTSPFGVYFSKVAVDISWTGMVFPVVFALVVWSLRLKSIVLAAGAGLVASLGLFSYPGVVLAAFAILLGMVPAYWLKSREGPNPADLLNRSHGRLMAAMLIGAAPFTIYAFVRHRTVLGVEGQQLLMGGGDLWLTWNAFVEGIAQVIRDSFISADSWYLVLRGMSFFEISLLPLAVLGFWSLLRGRLSWPWLSAFLAIPFLWLLVPFTGPYPGMRRAVYAVIPYSVAIACGVIVAIESAGTRGLAFRRATFLFLGLAVLHPLAYQFTLGRESVRWNVLGEGFARQPIPTDFLLSTLTGSDIVLESREFDGYFDGMIYRNYPRLYSRYNKDSGIAHEVQLVGRPLADLSRDELAPFVGMTFISWDSAVAGTLIAQGKLCMPPEVVQESSGSRPFWGVVAGAAGCGSLPTASLPALGPSFPLRYDKALRMVHGLRCPAAYCGQDRPSFVYAFGGEVSFMLKPCGNELPDTLELQVENALPDRENVVLVNDVPIGTLTIASLDATQRIVRMHIPDAARRHGEPWSVRLLPPPDGRQGWDIRHAALVGN